MLSQIAAVLASAGAIALAAQPTSTSPLDPPPNGVRRVDPAGGRHALVGATIHVSPTETIERGTLVIRDGVIESVAAGDSTVPPGAVVHDLRGGDGEPAMHIYAGFIEPYLEVDVAARPIDAPGAHWNPRITPDRSAMEAARGGGRGLSEGTVKELRELGFVAAAISPRGGIVRGTSAVISLGPRSGDPAVTMPRVYRDGAYMAASIETGFRWEDQGGEPGDTARWTNYPNSQMGAIALLRQTLADAKWQQEQRWKGTMTGAATALDALGLPQARAQDDASPTQGWTGLMLFDAGDELEALRCAKVAAEFDRPAAILGSGQEYQRLGAIVETQLPIVLPLSEPRSPRVGSVGEQNAVELDDLMHWEQAPTNPRRVDAALVADSRGGDVSLTTAKGESHGRGRGGDEGGGPGGFAGRLDTAIRHGLPGERALAMLTVNPARLLGVEKSLGTIEKGKVASFIVADGPLFTARPDAPRRDEPGYVRPGRIVSVWTDGRENIVRALPPIRIGGHYEVTFNPAPAAEMRVTLDIDDAENPGSPEVRITKITPAPPAEGEKGEKAEGREETSEINVSGFSLGGVSSTFQFSFDHEPFGEKGVFVNAGVIEREADGTVILRASAVRASGRVFSWTARRIGPVEPKKRSLAGVWPVVFDEQGGGEPVLVFDRGNVLTPVAAPGVRTAIEGKPLSVHKFSYDGRVMKYEFDQSQVLGTDGQPMAGIAKVEATVDWSVNPPRMTGEVMPPEGEKRVRFTAVRRHDGRSPFVGRWRVTQAGGMAKDPASADQLTITIVDGRGGSAAGGGRRGRGRSGGEGGESAAPGITLAFTRGGEAPMEIEAEQVEFRAGKLFFRHPLAKLGMEGESRDELTIAWDRTDPSKDVLIGLGRLPDGSAHPYQAARLPDAPGKEGAAIAAIPERIPVPFGPYGLTEQPEAARLAITGATIWTCQGGTTDTVIENGAIVISDGRIQYVGPSAGLPRLAEGFTMIDGAGKFITPGIIDCHSHTGISRGVNESGQAITAEVRIGDVTNPDDVSWYRQLAGGVTCVNNLHGSANAIGGQSMVNKIRWGCGAPDDMHFESDGSAGSRGAAPGIKFALGENPRGANSSRAGSRYPQTRMGVETLIRDRFTEAREYRAADSPRRDLELEALAEILAGTRLVHCHSYRQDEILMLCRVAEEFGFRIGTFQHILEGYKVADEMVKWSGGGSAFSDWWAYKVEVQDAIPFAGPLMAEQGVVVSYNSDSDEMARRLNVEAGKAAKYSTRNDGGMIPPHEAFKFVTLNPAKQLKIDAFTGSLEAGKDADIAVWSGVPTDATSRCEMTLVDGRVLFSLDRDKTHRAQIARERSRLIQKALGSDGAGGGDVDGWGSAGASDIADGWRDAVEEASLRSGRGMMLMRSVLSAQDYQRQINVWMLQRGLDPRWMRAGDCGCGESAGAN